MGVGGLKFGGLGCNQLIRWFVAGYFLTMW